MAVTSSWDPKDLFALQIARSALTGSPPPSTALSPDEVVEVLRRHKLLRLVDANGLGEGAALVLSAQRQQTLVALQRVRQAAQIRDCLQAAGVPALFFKGLVLSQIIWGSPAARGAGDIDVLVAVEDLERAVVALRRIGVRVPADVADLRPARLDRLIHHALCLDFNGVEVDLHYRLDDSNVLDVPSVELFSAARPVSVQEETFPTLSPELTLLMLAANGGRDLWAKWGQVLDFALLDAQTPPVGQVYGVGRRLASGRAMVEWLTGQRDARVSRRERRHALHLVQRHARAESSAFWLVRRQGLQDAAWRWRSAPSAAEARRTALLMLAPGDAAGRRADAGLGEYITTGARKASRTWDRLAMEPPPSLCDLVDAAERGELDRQAFEPLSRALRLDTFSNEDKAAMPFTADVIQRFAGDDPFAARITGVRRRARLGYQTSEMLVEHIRAHADDAVVLGDFGAAARLHTVPGDRPVHDNTVSVPRTRTQIWQVAQRAAEASGARLTGGRWPVLQKFDVSVMVHPSLGPGFFCDVDDSLEMVMYSSLVRAAQGAPRIEWYTDAVAVGDRVDWARVWEIAQVGGWIEPVARASAVLYARGWDVPIGVARDSLVSANFRGARSTRSRRVWLAAYAAQESVRQRRPVPV